MFRKIFISHIIIIVAGLTTLGFIIADISRDKLIGEINTRLESDIDISTLLLKEYIKPISSTTLQKLAEGISTQCSARVTIIDKDGVVIADSEGAPSTMDNHNSRPEVIEARQNGIGRSIRYSKTVNYEMLYVAKPLETGELSGIIVRMALPVTRVKEEVARIYYPTVVVFLMVGIITLLIDYLTLRHFTRPLVELKQVADAIARGDMTQKAPLKVPGEIGALSKTMNYMVNELSKRIETLREEKGKVDVLLKSIQEGVIALDSQGRIIHINKSAESLLNVSQNSVGQIFWDTVRHNILTVAVDKALNQQNMQKEEIECNGLTLSVCIYPIESIKGAVVVIHDITESKKYDNLRKEFIANVSHELRTPLTFIKGYVETLRLGALQNPVEALEFLKTIEKHVSQLTNLVNDLLELSRLESHPNIAKFRPTMIESLIRKVAESFQPVLRKKAQELTLYFGGNIPTLNADADLLERAISNLIDNANKYTIEGGSISIKVKNVENGVEILISDTGIGIPEKDIPRIFERFYRVDKSRSRELGGTGLGLAIVKYVLQIHHGSVAVESKLGKGTTFRIFIPLLT